MYLHLIQSKALSILVYYIHVYTRLAVGDRYWVRSGCRLILCQFKRLAVMHRSFDGTLQRSRVIIGVGTIKIPHCSKLLAPNIAQNLLVTATSPILKRDFKATTKQTKYSLAGFTRRSRPFSKEES